MVVSKLQIKYKNLNNLKKSLTSLGTFLGGVAGHHYFSKAKLKFIFCFKQVIRAISLNITNINSFFLRPYKSPGASLGITFYIAYILFAFLLLDTLIMGILNDLPTGTYSVSGSVGIYPNSTHSFISSSYPNKDVLSEIFEKLFQQIMSYFQPGLVQGNFDDLVGQRMFIQFLLLLIVFFVLILFMVFIFNVILILNKERILGFFNNKYILLFLKFEFFNNKIALFIIPFFILFGLFTLGQGLLWLLMHPIPYESLGVDLHQYVSSEKLILCIMIKNFRVNPHPSFITNNKEYK